jgi:hypothetical protein
MNPTFFSSDMQTRADVFVHNIRIFLAVEAIGTHDARFHHITLDMMTSEYRLPRLKQPVVPERLVSTRSSQPRFSGAG